MKGCIGRQEEKGLVRQSVCYYSCILCLEVVMQKDVGRRHLAIDSEILTLCKKRRGKKESS